MSEPRLLCFHDADEAALWQDALDAAGIPAQCITYDKPAKDERGYWQPPRWHWHDVERDGATKHVYIIDGGWFRTNVVIDFSEGGNHSVYPQIPPDCIYVEANNDENQIDAQIVADHHETPEDLRMEDDPHCVYEEAHGFATAEEREEREPYRDPQVKADEENQVQEPKSEAAKDQFAFLMERAFLTERTR